jgi:hypothetical protein
MRTTLHVGVAALAVNLLTAATALAEDSDAARGAAPRAHRLHDAVLPKELRAEPRADVASLGPITSGFAPQARERTELPMRFVDRPLTLPKFVLAPHFLFDITHEEAGDIALNAFGLTAGAAFGIFDDLEVYCDPLSLLIAREDAGGLFGGNATKTYYGTFRLGATYRFVKANVAEVGARLEFGATGAIDLIHLTWGVPVILRAPHVLRFMTGLFFSGLFPTQQVVGVVGVSRDPDIAMAAVGESAPVFLLPAGPGIPAILDFQIADPVFAGLDTGFGILSFRGDVASNCFMPLGWHIGGTIPSDGKPLVDLIGAFAFPLFLLGADGEPPATQLWTVGLSARAYIPL